MLQLKTVLCPVDFSETTSRALPLAARVCQRTGARLVLLHDVSGTPPSFLGMGWMYQVDEHRRDDEMAAVASKHLDALLATLPPGLAVEKRVTVGPRTATILHLARELPADLIVMATHVSTDPDRLSTTEQVIEEAPCPVLAVRADGPRPTAVEERLFAEGEMAKALVPLDFSSHAGRGLACAFGLARQVPMAIHLLHVEPDKSWEDVKHAFKEGVGEHRKQRVAEAEAKLKAAIPDDLADKVTWEVRLGAAGKEVLAGAKERGIDLVVMGVHEKDPVGKILFGATSATILHDAFCPIWFVSERAPVAAG